MLITITRKCNENCSHCMVSASPDGPHMSEAIFNKAVDFAIKCKSRVIVLSGGDIFLHPDVFKFIRIIENKYKKAGRVPVIVLESNGWWCEDEEMKKRINRLLDRESIMHLCISTHEKYYPNYQKICNYFENHVIHYKIRFEKNWQGSMTHLKYMGRAKNFMSEDEIKGVPGCLNIVSRLVALKNRGNLTIENLIHFCEETSHMCTPKVTVYGGIQLSEGIECKVIGNVCDNIHITPLLHDIENFIPCNKCKCMKNLTEEQLKSIPHLYEVINNRT